MRKRPQPKRPCAGKADTPVPTKRLRETSSMSCQEKVNGKTCGGTLEPGEEICSTCNPAHFAKIECKCGVRVREGGTCGICEQTVCSSVGKAVSVQQVQIKQCAGTKKNGEPCVFLLKPEFQACPICLTEVPWLSPPETEGRLPESVNDATSNQASQSDMAGFSLYAGMSLVDKVINAVEKAEVSNVSAEEEKKNSNNKELSKGVNAEEKNTSINLSDSGNRRNSRSAGSGRGQQTSGCSDTGSYRNASTATASAELKPLEKATSSDTSQRPVQVQNEQSGDATMGNKEQENAKDKQKLAQKNKGRSEQNSRSKNQSLEGARDDGIVVFHVIMSQLFKMDSDTDQVFIRCEPVHLGGFTPEDGDKHRMLLVKKCQVGYVYEGKIAMDKKLRNDGFAYKYVVKKHDKDDVHWEMVQKRDLSRRSGGQDTVNRRFKVPAEERMFCGEWHVYDGISYPRMSFKDAAVDTLKSAFGFKDIVARVRAESHHAGKEFLPSADHIYQTIVQEKHQQTAEDLLRQTKTVMRSLKQQMLDSNLINVDDDLVQQCFTENLIEPLLKRLSSMLKEGKRTVTLAMLVLLMIVENGIKASTSVNNKLCRMFLLIPDNERKHCPDLTDLEKQFPLKMKETVTLAQSLLTLINQTSGDDPNWLCCIPLVHFLNGTSLPFQKLELSSDFRKDDWWGLTGFERRKHTFKEATKDKKLQSDMVELLESVFLADQMLVKSIVASLEYEPLLEFLQKTNVPLEVIAASLSHYFQQKSWFYISSGKDLVAVLKKAVHIWTDELSIDPSDMSEAQVNTTKQRSEVVYSMYRAILECRITDIEAPQMMLAIQLMFLVLNRTAADEEALCKQNEGVQAQEWRRISQEVIRTACDWIVKNYSLSLLLSEKWKIQKHLKMWGNILGMCEPFTVPALKKDSEEMIADRFEQELEMLPPEDKLEIFVKQADQIVPAFMGILNRLAFESLEEAFKNKHIYLLRSDTGNVRLLSLLSNFLEKSWKEKVKWETDILQFVVTWVPMVNYLQNYRKEESMERLGKEASNNIRTAVTCLHNEMGRLSEGTMELKTVQFLLANSERFSALMVAIGVEKNAVEKLLMLRGLEVKAFTETSAKLQQLIQHCQSCFAPGTLDLVHANFRKIQESSPSEPVSKVAEIAPPDSISKLSEYKPKANPWKLPEEVLGLLPDFERKVTSVIFKRMFLKKAKSMKAAGPEAFAGNFWQTFLMLWKNVLEQWQTLSQKMIDGSVLITTLEKVLDPFASEEGSYNLIEVKNELSKMVAGNCSSEWVQERIDQFSCYMDMKKYVDAATVLLKVKDAFSVPGKFEDIKKICNLSQTRSLPIRDLDKSMLGVCKQLKGISPQDIHSLQVLVEPRCKEFVDWLKDTMKDGVKELNVFVDLASISAGDDPWAIAQVDCFHASATGYAPLIFMNKCKGCSHLLKQCKMVFANVNADPKLPEKLNDTSNLLDWFKDAQMAHGSVEKTSMAQVASINEKGVFKVCSSGKPDLSLQSVVQLSVSEEVTLAKKAGKHSTPDFHLRVYSYNDLMDLQSRLMLVAGQADKGKDNVDRFITVMESLVRLGKTYVKLCSDGCVLFLDWSVEFLCDIERPVCCISEFSNQGKLKGHRSKERDSGGIADDLEVFIAGVAGFLEDCHKEWLQYVDQKRKDYPQLNIYTVEQLVFLQQQLVRVGSDDVSKHVYPMLSLLKADCSPQDLEQALQEAMDHVDTLQQQEHCSAAQPSPKLPPVGGSDKMEMFVKELVETGFSRTLAMKAANEVGTEDVDNGIAWCMEHEGDMEDPEEEMNESEEEEDTPMEVGGVKKMVGDRLKEWVTRTETITQSAVGWLEKIDKRERGKTLQSLRDNLTRVWCTFLETVSSSGMDFLSLEHLGIVLRYLAAQDERQFNRQLQPNVKAKVPNLIVCPKREVLSVVTYMYMFPEDETALLPQPDEVLLCTENTTFEQVDIFLRRAFFGTQQKVYCLAFADTLDYDVGEKAEKKIKEYTNLTGDRDYKLVVVCSSENEYRARIVAALEKYRCPSPSLSTNNRVGNYLRSRFTDRTNKAGAQSASALDPESLCVRVVKSNRSGVGKTLYKQRLTDRLKRNLRRERRPVSITIPLHGRVADTEDMAACLLPHTLHPGDVLPRIVHLDISYEVQEGVDHLLYNLLVLGCVTDRHGQVWLRSPMDLYLVETIPLLNQKDPQKGRALVHHILEVLPNLKCWSPQESLAILRNPRTVPGYHKHDCLFDEDEFRSEVYQRPFRYLHVLATRVQAQGQPKGQQPQGQQPQGQQPQGHVQDSTSVQKAECLATILKYCGVGNPSWSELTHFVCFLDKQLQDFENSVYCGMATCEDLPGFSEFVLRFLIQMSRDFATRSLNMSEESLSALVAEDPEDTDIEQYEMRRTWESSPHPYIFFNPDGHSMTFLGFSIDPASGNLVDQQTGEVLEHGVMSQNLFKALAHNKVPLSEDFDILPREDRLLRLYRVLGLYDEEIFDDNNRIIDPDNTYELTTDNVKKILAIYMRFRCNIPVIMMGETGCGKTRLVKFLCALQTPRNRDVNTMVLVKVHGGTNSEDIIKKVEQAEEVAQRNAAAIGNRPVYTILFFDEANTTEAIGVIKEVMCDRTLNGRHSNLSQSLKMVAACNPYRKHSDELIKRLENAGLGYHVDADQTVDKLGRVPMRRLVYRVQPLPQSMLPLVWDFGQLNTRVEELYIRQMVRRYIYATGASGQDSYICLSEDPTVRSGQLGFLNKEGENALCKILMESQEFMRKLADECSFVSLRDVDRSLTVTSWFLQQAERSHVLFDLLDEKLQPQIDEEYEDEETEDCGQHEEEEEYDGRVSNLTKALVLSLDVCYRACLRSKTAYDDHIVGHFQPPFTLPGGPEQFALIIESCQDVFLDHVHLEDNIARNQALKENVFMMVVCVELRIPLFLVGKPGSSKSLAKTIVSNAMQGNSSATDLFRTLKQIKMESFQCSPLATADGILGMFRRCAKYQKDKDNFVSVVVLDEVGLAEDSPKMPLKTLHPLLEDGCQGDEVPEDNRKVAFIGISNWALDPAKMNRGILVQRDVPDQEELIETAKGICTTRDQQANLNMGSLIHDMAMAYLKIFEEAKHKREFFGLRDFYSLVKMAYAFAAKFKQTPSPRQLIAAIRRNFGGLDTIDPVVLFKKVMASSLCGEEKPRQGDPDCSASGLIKAAVEGDNMGGESRYLLLLTENYEGLNILSENLLAGRRVVRIFGSSFPKDQEYTQICRNINRIKVCMETGQTVILLNLENLYESLYDALNQYYAMLGGERYVDLGLGTHRVKCRVHRDFRLIVVAEKQVVYDKFPIPLINRLEKHFLTLNNIMTDAQLAMAQRLEKWAKDFVKSNSPTCANERNKEEAVGGVFMGYHPDTAPAIVLKVWDKLNVDNNPSAEQQVLEECQRMLLWCATPDALVRSQKKVWSEVYLQEQQHEHLHHYLQEQPEVVMAQVTTHSKLLTEQERVDLCESLPGVSSITLLSLQAFDTEQQFCQQLRLFFTDDQAGQKLLLVQCDSGDLNQNLIKCAQYCMQDLQPPDSTHHHVVFIIQLPRIAGACFTGFLSGDWHCLHIDELRATELPLPPITLLGQHTPAQLIMACVPTTDPEHINSNNANHNNNSLNQQHGPMIWEEGEETGDGRQPEEMEVDVEDVQVQLDAGVSATIEAAVKGVEECPPQGFDPQYVRHLFTTTVQAAVALVRDSEDSTACATHRITIMLKLIEENSDFFAGLHKLVGSILQQKERRAYEAERWLSKEAAKLDAIKKAGTFRRAWMQYLENKVVPVLAGAVAYLDTNHNLNILYNAHTSSCDPPQLSPQDTPTPEWVGQLWLGVLQGVCQLNYKQLMSLSEKDELDEFTVRHTGAASLPFSACLPFSWLLWELVDSAICEAKKIQGDLRDTAGDVVEKNSLGRCAQRALGNSEENLQDLFDLYTCDLLHFTFVLSDSQHKLLCGCMKKGLQQLHISLVELGLGRGVVALHMLVEQMRGRLQAVLDMSGVRPNAVEALRVGSAGPLAQLLNAPDEMTEDIAMLRLLVEELQPRPSQLDEERGVTEWTEHYSSVAPVVLRLLTDSEDMPGHSQQLSASAEGAQEEALTLSYGDRCRQQLMAIKCLWTRATTLKLFLDFVGPLKQGPEKLRKALRSINMKLMCKLLDEEVNMKQQKSLQQVDLFLKRTNGLIVKGLLGRVGLCTYCEKKFETAPVGLPCKHTLCNSCYRDRCHGNRSGAVCPQCETPVPPDFEPSTAETHDRESVELLGQYQRQISGFLMAVVSQLCFAGKEPPEPATIRHIFGYIIHRSKGSLLQTKHMTVHDDLIDPTPVLRSFLLRLLLKHSEKEVYNYLDEFLRNAKTVVEQEEGASTETVEAPTWLEFSLLIIHCLEDLHHEQEAVNSSKDNEEAHLLFLADTLQDLSDTLTPTPELLKSLCSLGHLRHALDACVHILYNTFVATTGSQCRVTASMKDMLTELQDVCQNDTSDWPKKFVVKQLCREYGIQAYMTLVKRSKQNPLLQWIVIQEPERKVEEVADRYLVCSQHYKGLRDQLAQCRLAGDFKDLMRMLQHLPVQAEQKEMLLLLALHREITLSVLHPMPEKARASMAENVKKMIQGCDILQDKAVAQQLCENKVGAIASPLRVRPNQDLGEQSLVCLLTHLQLVLRPGAYRSHLLFPLSALVNQPADMAGSFLPTMPQDNLQEVLAVIKEKVWQCPRGHRYLIGDCGRPTEEGMCPCGLRIGGVSHRPNSENVEGSGADQTQKGHILGSAGQRGMESVPERQLSAVECAVLRFLTHAALYLAASNPAQTGTVSQMVVPRIPPNQAAQYFSDHVQRDLQVLQRSLGRSADDTFLVLHHLCHQLSCAQTDGRHTHLHTKEERAHWERQFAAMFIGPAVMNVDTLLRTGNQAIVSDNRNGESALLKLVYEDEGQTTDHRDVTHIQTNPSVWRYRPRITVDRFFQQFHLQVETRKDKEGKYPVIRLFKAQRHILHALHFVPSILAGQRSLMMQLHRRLDRAEAATLTVAKVMEGKDRTSGLEELLHNFSKAWDIVKEHLIGFQCVAPTEGLVSLPEEYHNASMTTDSPIAVLLPSTQGPGLCSYILLQFLLSQNNHFLETYCPLVKQRYESLPEVSVKAVTERQVVGCSAERDVLPLVLAQCNYSLMVGQAATLDYDFAAFQQHLTDSLLQCKARIQRDTLGYIPVETMVFKADTTSSRLFRILREKIEQECLSPAERRQILQDLRGFLPDVHQSIDNLNTALSFLKALGGIPSAPLHEFMSTALKMKRTVYSHKAKELCKLTHVQSLWVLLCYQRACILAAHNEEAFDTIDKELRTELTPEQGDELKAACQRMSIDRLELLLLQLFECIMLRLSEPRDQDDDTRPANFKLRDVLTTNLETPLYHKEPVEIQQGMLTIEDLTERESAFPESLQGCHATNTWVQCHASLANKRQQSLF